jgi:hypothetical protein
LLRQKKHARRLNKITSVKIAGRAGIVISRTLLTVNINKGANMRTLTKKQKKILDSYISARTLEDLPSGIYEQLEKINDTEILWSEVNRYLNDNYLKHLYSKH